MIRQTPESERSAQQLMAIYARFGANRVSGIEKKQIVQVAFLPVGR
jgi:hypothetical protein